MKITDARRTRSAMRLILALVAPLAVGAGPAHPSYDVVIRGGMIYDGSGNPGFVGDVAIVARRIAAMGRVQGRGAREIDARGLAVAPGFINMLSWAGTALITDSRSQSDIRQGVTLERR